MNVITEKELCLRCLHLFSKPLFLIFQAHAVTKDGIVSAVWCEGIEAMWSHCVMNVSRCVFQC